MVVVLIVSISSQPIFFVIVVVSWHSRDCSYIFDLMSPMAVDDPVLLFYRIRHGVVGVIRW